MPKNTKRRKEKSADFAKAKLKLGKGKQLANNATDTSFRARSIVVPTQNIDTAKRDDSSRAAKSQESAHLLARLRHHSPSVRRDTLAGLRELLASIGEARNDALLGEVLEGCSRLIGDEDSSVRRALLGLFRWLLSSVPPNTIEPHAYLLVLHTMSGLSHIFPEVRFDAVRLLDLLLQSCPSAIASACSADGTFQRIVSSFCSLLGIRRRLSGDEPDSSARLVQSTASRTDVLKCLRSFLLAVTRSATRTSLPMWHLRSGFDSKASFDAFNQLLCSVSTRQQPWHGDQNVSDAVVQPVEITWDDWACLQWLSPPSVVPESPLILMQGLAADLCPGLFSICLEALAANASDDRPEIVLENLTVLHLTLELQNILFAYDLEGPYTSSPRSENEQDLRSFFSEVQEQLPLRNHSPHADIVQSETITRINQAYCQLAALFVTTCRVSGGQYMDVLPLSLVYDFILEQFQDPMISASEFHAFIPITWSLLVHLSETPDMPMHALQRPSLSKLIVSVFHHATAVPISSPLKLFAFEHVARLVLLQSNLHYTGPFHIVKTPEMQNWLLTVPQILWEAGGKLPMLTKTALLFLLRAIQQRNDLVLTVADTIAYHLIPFFYVCHPVQGALIGPIKGLSPSLQRLACEVASALPPNAKLAEAVELSKGLID